MSNTSNSSELATLRPRFTWPPNTFFKAAFITISVAALAVNTVLAAAILRSRLWRKNHVHIYYMVLLFADSLWSFGYIIVSATSIYTHTFDSRLNRLECTLVSFPFLYGALMYTGALVCISIDRFVAVGWPMFHRLNIRRLQRTLLAVSLCASTSTALFAFIGASGAEAIRTCGLGSGKYHHFRHTFTVVLWVGSVSVSTLYAVSIVSLRAYQRSRGNALEQDGYVTNCEERFSKSATWLVVVEFFTTTLGLSVIVFSTLANVESDPHLHMWVTQICIVFIQSNTLLSPLVLICQHKRLRIAIKALRRCSRANDEANHQALFLVDSGRSTGRNSTELTVQEQFLIRS